jgi:hypothetical protein
VPSGTGNECSIQNMRLGCELNLVLAESGPSRTNLPNPHAIAIAVETIPGVDGVAVRSQTEFAACECADQD